MYPLCRRAFPGSRGSPERPHRLTRALGPRFCLAVRRDQCIKLWRNKKNIENIPKDFATAYMQKVA